MSGLSQRVERLEKQTGQGRHQKVRVVFLEEGEPKPEAAPDEELVCVRWVNPKEEA